MRNLYSISMTTENTLRVLQRTASVFSRNRVNIEQLNVFETDTKGISFFNIVIYAEEKLVERVVKQLAKIVELREIHVHKSTSLKFE